MITVHKAALGLYVNITVPFLDFRLKNAKSFFLLNVTFTPADV